MLAKNTNILTPKCVRYTGYTSCGVLVIPLRDDSGTGHNMSGQFLVLQTGTKSGKGELHYYYHHGTGVAT